eukprot:2580011-Rhodomonas_salina.1
MRLLVFAFALSPARSKGIGHARSSLCTNSARVQHNSGEPQGGREGGREGGRKGGRELTSSSSPSICRPHRDLSHTERQIDPSQRDPSDTIRQIAPSQSDLSPGQGSAKGR